MKAFTFSTPIVAFIATSFIFPTPIAGVQGVGGWYIDETSCSPLQIAFLNRYLGRARIAHINVATYFTQYEKSTAFGLLAWQVLGGEDPSVAMLMADTVFNGGYDIGQENYPEIQGLASWKGPIPEAEAYNSPNGLIVYCNAGRLAGVPGRAVTWDKATETYYPVAMPMCPPNDYLRGAVAVLIHYVTNQPDHVTFCGWFLQKAMAAEARNGGWNTDKSVNGLRDLATEYSPNGLFRLQAWRNRRLTVLPRSSGLLDIDVSIGFDTFLTSVLAHTSAGGLKEMIGGAGQENIGYALPPHDSWRINQAVDANQRSEKALSYMLINSHPMGSQLSTTFLQGFLWIILLGIIFLAFILGKRIATSWSTSFLSSIASVHNKGDDSLYALTPSLSNTVKR